MPRLALVGAAMLAVGVMLTAKGANAADAPLPSPALPLSRYERVVVAPTKTSIYIGTVAMTLPTMERKNGGYEASYAAKVFPYFFYNEKGTMRIEFPDESLRKLARGEVVEFSGRAENTEKEERRVEGKATPDEGAGGLTGKIKVRVWVSKRVELIFNTTYRFEGK